MTKTIGAKVDDDVYEILKEVCEKEGVNVSDRVRDLVDKFVKEEAPFLVLDRNVCLELKRIAEKKGVDWKEMTCNLIFNFCRECSEKTEKEAKQEAKQAPVQKELSIAEILKGETETEEEAKEEASMEEKLRSLPVKME